MGEIAEALKRSRKEREASRGETPRATPAPDPHPGRSELTEALRDAGRADAEPPAPRVTPTIAEVAASVAPTPDERPLAGEATTPRDAEPPALSVTAALGPSFAEVPADEKSLVELSEAALSDVGKVDLHRQLGLKVAAELERRSTRSVAVVSALRDEGKTTVATTIAMALASVTSERCVAIVDLDLRNPSIRRKLDLPIGIGIESYFENQASLDAIRISVATPQLDVYPAVEPHHAAHELLARPQLQSLIAELERRYQAVIFDTPPTLLVPDASMMMKHIKCCITVARLGVSRARRVEEMLELLPQDAVIGKVLNAASVPKHDQYYYEYGYGVENADESGDGAPAPPQ